MRHILAILSLLMLVSCAGPGPDLAPDLGGVLNMRTQELYVSPDHQQTVLSALKATQQGEMYAGTVDGKAVSFALRTTAWPYTFSDDFFFGHDTLWGYLAKIYVNAKCGQTHPGFISDCIATFGPHKAFGVAMQWSVETWKDCMRGNSVCIELYKPVGTITYYQTPNCADTLITIREIRRYRCD